MNPEAATLFSLQTCIYKKTVLLGANGKHRVCVCTIHQNVKHMVSGGTLYNLAENRIK